jgi:hypothetical protein
MIRSVIQMTNPTPGREGKVVVSEAEMSLEQFLAWADEDTHAEWVSGRIIPKMPASVQMGDWATKRCLRTASRLCWAGALLLLITCARSDDGAIIGIGGTIRPMKSHPSLVLRSQVVKVKMNSEYADVDCTFVLHNTGKATSVLIGFPETGGGTDVQPSAKGFEYFHSYVDGKPVRVRVYKQEAYNDGYSRWYVKRVYFRAGQTRVIRNLYRMWLGFDSLGGRSFAYTLSTGASWKGKIGRADIIVQLTNLRNATRWSVHPKGYRRTGSQIVWRFRAFEPKEDIYVWFYPGGYRLYIRKGEDHFVPLNEVVQRKGVFLLSVHWLEKAGDFQLSWNYSAKSVRITNLRNNRQLVLRVGSRWAVVDGQRILLPAAPLLQRERGRWTVKVPIRAVVNALGGQVDYQREIIPALSITMGRH